MIISKELYRKGIIKNIKMLTQSQFSNYKFVAKLEHIKHFCASLRSINFDETATFEVSEIGFKVFVENAKFIQANLFITQECFQEFHVAPGEIVRFSVNINILNDCLAIFTGLDCHMKILYKGRAAPLVLILEHYGDEDVTTECSIKTKHHEDHSDYELDDESPSFNCICIRGPDLSTIFAEIDKSADELEICMSPKEPYFRLASFGVMQSESNIEIAKTSDIMLLFKCRALTTARYKFSHMKMTIKALAAASKVAMKTDTSGLLEMQFMITSEGAAQMYIQFFITPLVDFD